IDSLGGRDTISLVGPAVGGPFSGGLRFIVDAGTHESPSVDEVVFPGVANAGDFLLLNPATSTNGVGVLAFGAGYSTDAVLSNAEQVVFDGGGGVGQDFVEYFGTTGDNSFTLQPDFDALTGEITVDSFPSVFYENLGSGGVGDSPVVLIGGGGVDHLNIIDNGTSGVYTYTPNSIDSADLLLTTPAPVAGTSVNF